MSNVSEFWPASPISFFASHTSGMSLNEKSGMDNWARYRFYYFRVYNQSGKLVREFIPAVDTQGTNAVSQCGLYETQTGTFHPNLGSINGTITTSGAGTLYLGVDGGYVAATNLDLHASCALNIINDVSLRDYKTTYTGNSNSGTAEMTVSGTFTPQTDCFYGCTLQDGVTIDFSERETTLSVVSSFTSGSNTLSFAPYATIFIFHFQADYFAFGSHVWTCLPFQPLTEA